MCYQEAFLRGIFATAMIGCRGYCFEEVEVCLTFLLPRQIVLSTPCILLLLQGGSCLSSMICLFLSQTHRLSVYFSLASIHVSDVETAYFDSNIFNLNNIISMV